MQRLALRLLAGTTTATAFLAAIALPAHAGSPTSRSSMATVSVLHAIPNLEGDRGVDVYADRKILAKGLVPGDVSATTIKPGTYSLTVLPHGASIATGPPLHEAQEVTFRADGNHTVALHLTPTMATTATVFTNETRTVGQDMGRLTIRNIAQGPSVDIRSRGSVLMKDVRPGTQQDVGLRSGDYTLRVVRSDSRRPLVPASVHPIENAPGRQDMGDNRIVYLWGSAADASLSLAVQEIPLDLR